MNYRKHYDKLIETRKNRVIDGDVYYEKHHIVMKSMGGSNESENLVMLTAREHFLAHWLLWRIYRNRKSSYAFFSMCQLRRGTRKELKFSSIAYQEARESVSHSEETRLKLSKPRPTYSRGPNLTPEHATNIGIANLGKNKGKTPWMKGKIHKQTSLDKMRIAKLGKPTWNAGKIIAKNCICERCGKEIAGKGNLKRHMNSIKCQILFSAE